MAQIIYNSEYDFQLPIVADDLLEKAIETDTLDSIIIVVPTGKLERRLKQNAVRQYYKKYSKPIPSIDAFTLNGFVEYCYDKIFSDRKRNSISDAYRLALLDEASGKADLKFYSSNQKRISPVLLQRLANVIFGLKEDGMTVEALKNDISKEEELAFYDSSRLEDVIKLYEKYEELLEGKYLDFPAILNKITDYLNRRTEDDLLYNSILRDKQFVLFNGFSDFKMPEVKFISLFTNSKIPFALHIDYSTNNGPLFGNLVECINEFCKNGLKISSPEDTLEKKYLNNRIFDTENSKLSEYPRERYLRTRLFNTDTDVRNKAFSNIVKIIEAENRTNEVKYIAKLSKYLLLKENYKPNDICICMRQPDIYSNIFREIFNSYKIPANISDRYELSASPVVISLFSVLDIINYEYRIADVHKTLLSSYLCISDETFDSKNLFSIAQRFRIMGGYFRGGADYWEKMFESRITASKIRLDNMKFNIAEQSEEIERAEQDLANIEKALVDFKSLRSAIPTKKKLYSPKEFNDLINQEIIEKLSVKRRIQNSYQEYLSKKQEYSEPERIIFEEAIEKDAKALTSFIGLLNESTYITSDREPGKKFTLFELINKIKIAVTGQKYQIREKQNLGVNITSIEQTRGIPYKALILCGTVDGEFPMNYRPETFLGKELKDTIERHIQSERIQFYQFLTNDRESLDKSDKRIYITYPQRNEAEELVRSSFIDALLKITSLKDDGKVYNIAQIKNALTNNKYENHTELIKQSEELPWLNLIESENELYFETGTVLKQSRQQMADSRQQLEVRSQKSENINLITNYELRITNEGVKINANRQRTLDYIDYFLNRSGNNTGMIDFAKLTEDARKRIERIKDNPISITDLETYVKCPFKLFVKKILRIPEPREPELELSPLDIGNILHSIVYQFYSGNQAIIYDDNSFEYNIKSYEAKFPVIVPVTLHRKNTNAYLTQLQNIAEKEFDIFRFEHPFFDLETERILGTVGKPGLLQKWLLAELERIEQCNLFKPVLFEFAFGTSYLSKSKSHTDFIEIDGLKLQGKVDRIELMKENEQYCFMIGDYKNKMSNVAKNSEIKNCESFQMPLYILAVKNILKDYYSIDAEPMGGIYYGFEQEVDTNKSISHKYVLAEQRNPRIPKELKNSSTQVLKSSENLEDILKHSLETAKQIVDKISNGIFPINPANNECKYCGFSSICRIKEKKDIDETFEAES
ncbi:MAG: PD-(D/E)XK nuclease family protein [bacterium]